MSFNGEINLQISSDEENSSTYISKNYYKLPLQVMLPKYEDVDGAKIIYLLNPTGGLFQDDNLQTTITVEKNAKAYITTPSASKVYKCEGEKIAKQHTEITVCENSELEYFPDLMIPYEQSALVQTTTVNLSASSTFITCDFLCAGRVSIDELYKFTKYDSKMSFFVDGKCILHDQTKIIPKDNNVNNSMKLGKYTYIASIYVYSNRLSNEILEQLLEIKNNCENMKVGISMVQPDLLLVKILGNQNWEIKELIDCFWSVLRTNILKKEALIIRK